MPETESKTPKHGPGGYQFGTFKGVFTPSILTILGAIMYLRLGWVLGNTNLPQTLLIVSIASSITFLTGLSLSALATNRKVEGGGAYYIISRSLGVEAGAAVGIPLFFAQALGISFYTAAFSEALLDSLPQLVPQVTSVLHLPGTMAEAASEHAGVAVGIFTLIVLTAIAYKSADLALRLQFVVMAAIVISLVLFFSGSRITPEAVPAKQVPDIKPFWYVFAVFFPAVTGIEVGIAMSGDLKNPARSLPLGTIGAILTGYAIYLAIPLFLAFTVSDRELLRAHPMIMKHVARWGPAVLLGVCAATLSSAMGALLGAPRTLQALARDRVVPRFLGRGFGKGNDPRIATAVAFAVGLAGILLGNINLIAPILTMFFLTSYGLLNVAAGLEELTSPPSWRPKFRVPWPLSFIGAFACFATMFMINAGATFIAAFVVICVYLLMERRSLKARWGDMRNGILMLVARNAIHALARRKTDERTWKPNILVLSGAPTSRWYLIELASAISRETGFLTVAAIVPEDTGIDRVRNLEQTVTDLLEKRQISALVKVYPADTPMIGARMLVKTYGYGPITPNTILLGETEQPENYAEFARLIQTIKDKKQNLVIVREGDIEPAEKEKLRIDIWWYGAQQNLGFMLALAHLLKRGTAWRHAALVLKSVVTENNERQEAMKHLETFISGVRIQASAEVLKRTSPDIFSIIRDNSQGADLVFLGIRAPQADETVEQYSRYYHDLLSRTEGLPPAALVLASEDMDFAAIFKEA